MRRRIAAACAFATLLAAPAAHAFTVGIADEQAASFGDPRLASLGLPVARHIVPWDAATSEPLEVRAWLDAVEADGMVPEIAFQHRLSDKCPNRPCVLPTRAQYGAAVRAFIALFPDVRTYSTWDEGNHEAQPTMSQPAAAAGFYEELVAACPGCTIVAADVLGGNTAVGWLKSFQAATRLSPQLWGVQNYEDVVTGSTKDTDAVLATVPGQVWVEETGGIVSLKNQSGRTTLTQTESQAATSIHNAFALVRARPRIARMYVYQWRANAGDKFDSGLVRPDGTVRPGYAAFVQELRNTTSAATATAAVAAAKLRWRAAWSAARPGTLLVRVTCPTGVSACAGRVSLTARLRTKVHGTTAVTTLAARAAYRTTTAKRTATLRIKVTKAVRRRIRKASARRLALAVTQTTPVAARGSVRLALARPR